MFVSENNAYQFTYILWGRITGIFVDTVFFLYSHQFVAIFLYLWCYFRFYYCFTCIKINVLLLGANKVFTKDMDKIDYKQTTTNRNKAQACTQF